MVGINSPAPITDIADARVTQAPVTKAGSHLHGTSLSGLPFHQVLVEAGMVSQEQASDALAISRREGTPLERSGKGRARVR